MIEEVTGRTNQVRTGSISEFKNNYSPVTLNNEVLQQSKVEKYLGLHQDMSLVLT